MAGDLLHDLEPASVLQVIRDPRRAEAVAADFCANPGLGRAASDDLVHIRLNSAAFAPACPYTRCGRAALRDRPRCRRPASSLSDPIKELRDNFGNQALVIGDENSGKQNRPLHDSLATRSPEYLKRHFIPKDNTLWYLDKYRES